MRRSKFKRPCKVLIFNGARVLVAYASLGGLLCQGHRLFAQCEIKPLATFCAIVVASLKV